MRILLFSLFVLCGIEYAAAGSETLYKTHTFEFAITPGFDYHFITNPKRIPSFAANENSLYRPFVGGNAGLAYTYRPIQYFGVSTGINFIAYVRKMGIVNNVVFNDQFSPALTYTPTSLRFKGYITESYIDIPILLHAYLPVKKFELEFATGPEFIFPVLTIEKYTLSSDSTIYKYNASINRTEKFSGALMQRFSTLGWDVQLTANIAVKKYFDISIGPEFKLIHLYAFNRDQPYVSHTGSVEIDYYVGLKFGFRFGPARKISATTPQQPKTDREPAKK